MNDRVDLSQAYNGCREYSVPTQALNTLLSNFAGPIFWSFAVFAASDDRKSLYHSQAAFRSASLTMMCISAIFFRTHLFTWSVFSPAVLYKAVWMFLVHAVVNTVAMISAG